MFLICKSLHGHFELSVDFCADHAEDYKELEKALTLCKQLAIDVDDQVNDRENYVKLIDVHEKTDHRCTTTFKGEFSFKTALL